jgi:3-oxoadipate enol-lactonase
VAEKTSTFLPVNGGRLYYERAGQGDAVVFIHAGIADSRMWDALFEGLSTDHLVVRYDQRGFGQSDAPTEPFKPEDDLRAVMQAVGVDRAALIGASLGGRVAIHAALEGPQMAERLVLIAPGISGFQWSDSTTKWWPEIEAAFEAGAIGQAVELETRMWVDGPGRQPGDVDPAIRSLAVEMGRRVYELNGNEDLAQETVPNAIDRLDELRMPVLVILGEGDLPDMHTIADTIAERVTDVRLEHIPVAAHLPSMERPHEVEALVRSFLDATANRAS